jgi:type II secretory pathway pseudopilin PulG
MRIKSHDIKFGTLAAWSALAVVSLLAVLAVPMLSPSLRARQLDDSAQDLAGFLQQARNQSIQRGAPVACGIGIQGYRTVLTLDWNLNGRRTQPQGSRLVLPWGLVLLQEGAPRQSGTVAAFNPRGGFTFRSARPGPVEPAVLSLSQSNFSTNSRREISMTSGGLFKITSVAPSGSAKTAGPAV